MTANVSHPRFTFDETAPSTPAPDTTASSPADHAPSVVERTSASLPSLAEQVLPAPLAEASPAAPAAPALAEDPRETAARAILAAAPGGLNVLATEMAYQYLRLPLWATLVGALYTLNEWGLLSSITVPPTVRHEVDHLPAAFSHSIPSVCGWCKTPFRPRWWKQTYCTNECGSAAQVAAKLLLATAPSPVPDVESAALHG